MRITSLRQQFALAAGLLTTLIVVLFALFSAWRFYGERLEVMDERSPAVLTPAEKELAMEEVLELMGVYLISLPVVAALSGGCAWWIGGRLTGPLVTLAKAADRINARTLHQRIPETLSSDEIGRVTRIFNGMLDRLEKSFAQSQRFSADASHELHTPLAIMRARIEIAIAKNPGSAQAPDLVALLEDNQRLTKITANLLALARADAGKLVVEAQVIDLTLLLEEIVEDFSILANERAIRFESRVSERAFVRGDSSLLRQLFLNLFENAVKYTAVGGGIEAGLSVRKSSVVFRIKNVGAIIPAGVQHRLFERFFRASDSRDPESGGTGLGLSLGLEIANAHGGELKLISSDAAGTIFQVLLPAAEAYHPL